MLLTGFMSRKWWFAAVAGLAACGEAPPPCTESIAPFAAQTAGCLVSDPRGILLVRDWRGQLALPGGSVLDGESAHCGAERETFEETGLPVAAQMLAQRFDNGFHLFWCQAELADQPRVHRPLEVKEVGWWQPAELPGEQWRYPGQGEVILELIRTRNP